jgi:biopolymer transport protein ExbD
MARHALAYPSLAEEPISDLNTTPLIDVMLVLLIMFIVTVPIATHKVPLDLPTDGPARSEPIVYQLDLDEAGRISLDGRPLTLGELGPRLRTLRPDDELRLRAAPTTPYGRYDEVLAEIKRAGVARLGTVGNERFAAALD